MVNSSGGKSERVLPAVSGMESDYPPARYQNPIPVKICKDSDFSYINERPVVLEFFGVLRPDLKQNSLTNVSTIRRDLCYLCDSQGRNPLFLQDFETKLPVLFQMP
jgi:hypothetical protein